MTEGSGYPMSENTKRRIRVMADDGHKSVDIARVCGCSARTVRRVQIEADLTKSAKQVENIQNQGQRGEPAG